MKHGYKVGDLVKGIGHHKGKTGVVVAQHQVSFAVIVQWNQLKRLSTVCVEYIELDNATLLDSK